MVPRQDFTIDYLKLTMLSLIIFIIINITIIVIFYAIAKPIFHVITGMKKILHLMMPFNASNKFIVYNLHGHVFL